MKKRRRLRKTIIAKFIIFICLIGLVYSCHNIFEWKKDIGNNAKIKKQIDYNIKETKDNEKKYKIDFKSLKKQNADTVAYLKVKGTNINYIVVRGKDNSYYLKHNFEKKYNNAGWIFSDYHNQFNESDKNIVIYGHDTKDGSMFGTLKNILNKDWYKNKANQNIILVTEDGTYYYQVFSTYSIKPEDYYINTKFEDDNEFDKFIKTLKSRSIYDYGVEIYKEDKILTLSSCIYDGKKRVVLHAKLIKKYN